MKDSASPKQQIIQSIKDANNILIAVSADPSVDELSAALGLTLFLNKLDKHATAVFSGKIPPAITFLEPDKTFEGTADSLRDFIIALDKEKADHLRYKVVDDAVKIFITPYRTKLSEKDLEFSQGDYNVELVLALNVDKDEHLDAALTAHGRILHDAEIATITSGDITSSLGSIDWHEKNASGVSEMLTEIIDGLKTPKVALDEQMANALLTGIVASTDRFSNDLTSSKVMTAAAELMAAGANQKLIVTNLSEGSEVTSVENAEESAGGDNNLKEGQVASLDKADTSKKAKKKSKDDGALSISHERSGSVDEVANQVRDEQSAAATKAAQDKLASLDTAEPGIPRQAPTQAVNSAPDQPQPNAIANVKASSSLASQLPSQEPLMGGTLNATSDQAAKDKQLEAESDRNRTILSHGSQINDQPASSDISPINSAMSNAEQPKAVDPFKTPDQLATQPTVGSTKTIQPLGSFDSTSSTTASAVDAELMSALTQDTKALSSTSASDAQQSAMNAVEAALNQAPAPQAGAAAPAETASTVPAPVPGQTLADLEKGTSHGLPPMPDFSTLPPPPPAPVGVATDSLPNIAAPQPAPGSNPPAAGKDFNPSQFQIPGSK